MIYRFLATKESYDMGYIVTIYGDVDGKFIQLHKANIDFLDMLEKNINHICDEYIGGEINEMLAKYGDAYDIGKINTQIL